MCGLRSRPNKLPIVSTNCSDPFGRPRRRDPVTPDLGLRDVYRKLIALRRANLRLFVDGTVRVLLTDDEAGLLAYERAVGAARDHRPRHSRMARVASGGWIAAPFHPGLTVPRNMRSASPSDRPLKIAWATLTYQSLLSLTGAFYRCRTPARQLSTPNLVDTQRSDSVDNYTIRYDARCMRIGSVEVSRGDGPHGPPNAPVP